MSFQLPDLTYDYSALEPHIDARTMEIHHSKHHAAYTANFNKALEGTSLEGKSAEEIFAGISAHPAAVRNNGGGYFNHKIFWSVIGPNGGGEPTGDLLDAINSAFGLARPISSDARITRRRAINFISSPPASILASQYTAASGSLPRTDLIKAEIMS